MLQFLCIYQRIIAGAMLAFALLCGVAHAQSDASHQPAKPESVDLSALTAEQKEAYKQAQIEYAQKLKAYHQALVPKEAKLKIEAFHRAVNALDRNAVALSVCYPARIMFRDKQINIENRAMFLQHFDAVFTPRFIHTLKQIDWTPSVIGNKGITIGGGQVWFDMNGCVVTFNNNLYVM